MLPFEKRGIFTEYIAPIYKSAANARNFPVAEISCFPWEVEGGTHPESFAAMFAVEGEGLHALLWSFEENIRCECKKRDDPVYTDSCLELFLMPVEGDSRYINVEVNKDGVYLSQLGSCRSDRVFIKELTDLEPTVLPMELEEDGRKAWGCEIILSESFISELFQTDFHICEATVKGNFYKCAELSANPHFGSYFPVGTPEPDFHRPEFFGNIIIRKA